MMKIRCLYLCLCMAALAQVTEFASATYNRRTPVVEAVEKTLPSVVNISTTKQITLRQPAFRMRPPFFDFGFPFGDMFERTYQLEGLGSGVLVGDGYVVTNHHVIDYDWGPADKIYVTPYSENEPYEASIVGTDPMEDIAILAIKSEVDLPGLHWGRSDDLMIGETVIAVGSSLGQPFTVTEGIISALNRTIAGELGVLSNLIQTNADINQGNSGGPLVNINGEFIGLNTAIMTPSGGSVGLGFAIPVARVKRIFDYWVHKKLTVEDQLKVYTQELSPQLVYFYKEEFPQLSDRKLHGIVVAEVVSGGLAEGKLQKIDLIQSVNGVEIQDQQSFSDALELTDGNVVRFNILRDGKPLEITLRTYEETIRTVTYKGMQLQEIDSHWRRRLDLNPQANYLVVLSVEPDGPAAKAGVKRGDILESVRTTRRTYELNSLDELIQLKEAVPTGAPVLAEILHKRNTYGSREQSWERFVLRLNGSAQL